MRVAPLVPRLPWRVSCSHALSTSVLFALLAIVVIAPFERPLVAVPGGFTLTTVEAALIVAGAAIVAGLGPRRLLHGGPTPLALSGSAFLLALVVAAIAAPADMSNALRFVARMLVAGMLFVLTLRVVRTPRDARLVAHTMLAVSTVVAVIALLESAQVPAVMSALTIFRPGFHVVAGQLRATSTLFYPTITSMYLEVAFALGVWLLLDPHARANGRRNWRRAVVFAELVLVGAGIAATFTRAGLIGMAAAMALIAALRLARVPRAQAGVGTMTALASALVVVVFFSHAPDLLATRLTTEGSQAWYGARYQVPASLALSTGRLQRVPIVVSNTGRLTWNSSSDPAFTMAYHWLRAGSGEVVQFDGARTAFPRVVAPGETIAFDADVIAPGEPGSYTLVWDVVHETRAWLSTEGVAAARTNVTVSGAPVTTVATTMARLPSASVTPARPALWSAAMKMAADHPWLGVGPDNYRLRYGPYLQLREWDRRVHANNMYLEVLAGAGLPGLLALVGLVGVAGVQLWSRAMQARGACHAATAAAFAVWMMIAGHGLVDSFLSFTTTYATFALAAGVAFSSGLIAPAEVDAHRV